MACNLKSTPARTQQRAFILSRNAEKELSCKDKIIKTSMGSNLGRQNVNEFTKLTFDDQQVGDNMKIDDNDCFEEFEDNSPPGNGQD